MRLLIRALFAITLFFSLSVSAEWRYEQQPEPKASPVADSIKNEVSKLPDSMFITVSDERRVSRLVRAVLSELSSQTDLFEQALLQYGTNADDDVWFDIESHYLTLQSLNRSKQTLYVLADATTNNRYTGFGPDGVTQFKNELWLTSLNAQYLIYYQVRSFNSLTNELLISPIPVIWTGIKVIAVYLVLMWWLARSRGLIAAYKSALIDNNPSPSFLVKTTWYLSRANVVIAWLIAITLSLRILSDISSLQHVVYLEILTWWVLGGSIVIRFALEFVYRNSRVSNPEVVAMRLSTIRRYVWSAIIAGVILQISMRTLGKGTIYSWIYSALFFWFVLVTISVLRMWRTSAYDAALKLTDRPIWAQWAILHKETWLLNIPATAMIILWLFTHRIKHQIISMLSGYHFFSQALAHLFRIEVAKQTNTKGQSEEITPLTRSASFDYVLPGNIDSELIDYALAEIEQLSHFLLTDSPAVCVLSAERGVGTTTALRTILNRSENAEPIYLSCPYVGYSELLAHLAVSLGLEEDASEVRILSHLRKSEVSYVIAIDNAQRLVKPMVGGLKELIRITNLLRRSKKNHRVVFAIEKASWRFVDRARGERLLFDHVSFLPRWDENQIGRLLDTRINAPTQAQISFDGLVVPKQWDHEEISEEQRAKQGFYRILWHYSDGNPTVALRFFRLSLYQDKHSEQVYVRLFNAPESTELETMPKPMLAVLRSIVQLEVASPEILSDCTQLTIAEITGILRYFQSRGYIEWTEDNARISDHWFRHITNVLDRQHLLVK